MKTSKVNSVKRAIGLEVFSEFLSDKSILTELLSSLEDDVIGKLRDDLSSILIDRAGQRCKREAQYEYTSEALDIYKVEIFKAVAHINTRCDKGSYEVPGAKNDFQNVLDMALSVASTMDCQYESDSKVRMAQKEIVKALFNIATVIESNPALDVELVIRFKEELQSKLVDWNDVLSELAHHRREDIRTQRHLDIWCTVALEAVKTLIETDHLLDSDYVDKLLLQRVMIQKDDQKSSLPKCNENGCVYRAMVGGQLEKWNGTGRPPKWFQDLLA